jgi:hypothetical protein
MAVLSGVLWFLPRCQVLFFHANNSPHPSRNGTKIEDNRSSHNRKLYRVRGLFYFFHQPHAVVLRRGWDCLVDESAVDRL